MCADQYGVKELKDYAEDFLLSRRRITFKNLPIRKLKEFYDIADAANSMNLKKGFSSLNLLLIAKILNNQCYPLLLWMLSMLCDMINLQTGVCIITILFSCHFLYYKTMLIYQPNCFSS